jgi:gliding motility-associated-like protein
VIADQYQCADTLDLNIHVNPLPIVRATPDTVRAKYGREVQLMAVGADRYAWSPADQLDNPRSASPVIRVTEPTVLVVNGVDTNQCDNNDTVVVEVDYRDNLFVPSAFSPNGDGKNDYFRISNLSFQKVTEFRVFNRWGQEILSTNDGRKGWDGTWKGIPQDPGTYNYIIRVVSPDGLTETYKGVVTLIR